MPLSAKEMLPYPDTATLPRARLRCVPPDAKLVDLSFAGRLRSGDPSLAAIAAASPGDPVQLIRVGDRRRIDNAKGQTLARLARAFAPPDGKIVVRGEVAAILHWRRQDGIRSIITRSAATPGRWSCPNWCSKPAIKSAVRVGAPCGWTARGAAPVVAKWQ